MYTFSRLFFQFLTSNIGCPECKYQVFFHLVICGHDFKYYKNYFKQIILTGFEWSVDERCALVQKFGGPCAVIAPVQGYFLQKLLFDDSAGDDCLPQVNPDADLENISGRFLNTAV